MAKTYLDIAKYMIIASFTIDGLVEKPDIIGAVFGQTEGLLGDELDLRELQKNGKIGRIEIDVSQSGKKSYGKLYLPASLDRVETCILAAAIEAVARVGPYDSEFKVEKVEDTRMEKRKKIIERAKGLLKELLNNELPDSKEIRDLVESEVKASEISYYGEDQLPAGPDIESSEGVIFVEGRADVLNLLRNGITNAIAIGGASTVPETLIKLSREKEVTVFLDGDRGGDMVLKNLATTLEIDYVARAPDGKEVEELTRKEILKSLKNKVPIEQYLNYFGKEKKEYEKEQREEQSKEFSEIKIDEGEIEKIESEEVKKEDEKGVVLDSVLYSQLMSGLEELQGTLNARIYDKLGNVISQGPVREVLKLVENSKSGYALVIDGVITQRLRDLCAQKGIKAIYGIRANPLAKKDGVFIYTKEQSERS
ncbi:MAG: DNA primase DnaG [Candidatus Micrarchaeaceae archaeon]